MEDAILTIIEMHERVLTIRGSGSQNPERGKSNQAKKTHLGRLLGDKKG